jgi:hypothetical protein
VVEGVQKQKNFNAMISENLDSYKDNVDNSLKITKEEYKQWGTEIDRIEIPDNVFNVIDVIRKKLQLHNNKEENKENQIYISDRRWRKIVRLLRTSAFLNDRNAVDLMDCFLIKDCLWNEEVQRNLVYQIVRDTIQNYGYNITPKLKAIENELADFWKEIAQKTTYVKDIYIPKVYDNYYLIKDVLNSNRLIEIETYNKLTNEYASINLFNERNNGYYGYGRSRSSERFTVKCGNQPNCVCFDKRVRQGEYDYNLRIHKDVVEIKEGTIKKLETIVFKWTTTKIPATDIIYEWNEKLQKVLEITTELKSNIAQYEKQDLAVYNSNILINIANTQVFIENLQYAMKMIEKLEIEVARIKHFYEHIKQDDNISLSILNLVTNHNHFALVDLIDYDFRKKDERRENKFFNKEKCQTLKKYNIVNSNDFLSIDKEFVSKLLDGNDNYERFKEVVFNRIINLENVEIFKLKDIDFEWEKEVYDNEKEDYTTELELLKRRKIITSEDFLKQKKSYFEFLEEDRYNKIQQAIIKKIVKGKEAKK